VVETFAEDVRAEIERRVSSIVQLQGKEQGKVRGKLVPSDSTN